MKILDPVLNNLTSRHHEIFWRYQVVRTGVDFSAAACFVVGSVCFFYASLSLTADWLFLIGSLLFAVKPTIDLVRSVHLRRLPTDGGASPAPGAVPNDHPDPQA
jgi:YrhK-like protein